MVDYKGCTLLAGHPLLDAVAKSNREKWAVPDASETPLSVTYTFRLADPKFIEVDEPIGDKFDRFFLRLFRRPVTRRVKGQVCVGPKFNPVSYAYTNESKDGIQSIRLGIEADSPCIGTDVPALLQRPVITGVPVA